MTGWLASAYLCGYSARCACVTLYTRINMNPFLIHILNHLEMRKDQAADSLRQCGKYIARTTCSVCVILVIAYPAEPRETTNPSLQPTVSVVKHYFHFTKYLTKSIKFFSNWNQSGRGDKNRAEKIINHLVRIVLNFFRTEFLKFRQYCYILRTRYV